MTSSLNRKRITRRRKYSPTKLHTTKESPAADTSRNSSHKVLIGVIKKKSCIGLSDIKLSENGLSSEEGWNV